MFRLKDSDLDLLLALGEQRALLPDQLALACGGHPEALAKRLRQLTQQGWLVTVPRAPGTRPGRPQKLLSLSPAGLQLLSKKNRLPPDLDPRQVRLGATETSEHLILSNWLLVHLKALNQRAGFLEVEYLWGDCGWGQRHRDLLRGHVTLPDTGKKQGFEPDAAFCLHHKTAGKSLLFQVEIDTGTETLANTEGAGGDIRGKIRCYQSDFAIKGYERFEGLWKRAFNGFRLLIVTSTAQRRAGLCRLTQQMPPSNFVWVTDHTTLLTHGLHGFIWIKGGQDQRPAQSILGSAQNEAEAALREGGHLGHGKAGEKASDTAE